MWSILEGKQDRCIGVCWQTEVHFLSQGLDQASANHYMEAILSWLIKTIFLHQPVLELLQLQKVIQLSLVAGKVIKQIDVTIYRWFITLGSNSHGVWIIYQSI